jgi:hypothetical protein
MESPARQAAVTNATMMTAFGEQLSAELLIAIHSSPIHSFNLGS